MYASSDCGIFVFCYPPVVHGTPPPELTRRALLRTLGGATILVPWLSDIGQLAFADLQRQNLPPAPKAFSPAAFAALEALVEAIIPADDRSAGAGEARVADYIDLLVSETGDELAARWSSGLEALDAAAVSRFGRPFTSLSPAAADAIMMQLAGGEAAPSTPLEQFFVMAKQATIHGYYTSQIGIHKELQYQGNRAIVEFVGCETVEGRDCPHCGQKAGI